jgi:hypothetical protein
MGCIIINKLKLGLGGGLEVDHQSTMEGNFNKNAIFFNE